MTDSAPVFATLLCLTLVMLTMLILMVGVAVRIVPEYKRLVVFRLGHCLGVRGPGLLLLLPFIDTGVPVDLRSQSFKLNNELALTRESIRLRLDVDFTYRVLDPQQAVMAGALRSTSKPADQPTRDKLAGLLRQAVGELDLSEAMNDRPGLVTRTLAAARPAFEPWGVEVTGLELRDLRRD